LPSAWLWIWRTRSRVKSELGGDFRQGLDASVVESVAPLEHLALTRRQFGDQRIDAARRCVLAGSVPDRFLADHLLEQRAIVRVERGASSELMCSVTQNSSATAAGLLPMSCASSSMVGGRARLMINCRRARSTCASSRSTWTGTRTVRLWCMRACCTDWRIHQTAYVEKRSLRSGSNFSTARIKPEVALLDQVQQRHTASDKTARHGDDEAQVRLDHLATRFRVACPDERRQAQLVVGAQQRDQADFVEVRAGRVARFLVLRLDRIDQLEQVFGFKFSGGRQQAHARRILRRAPIGSVDRNWTTLWSIRQRSQRAGR
jgi:hypothetical protein